jgi:hypothetical protein
MGFGKTHFASPDDGFKVLYAAESLARASRSPLSATDSQSASAAASTKLRGRLGVTELSTSTSLTSVDFVPALTSLKVQLVPL